MLGFVKGKPTCDCLFAAEIVCSPWRYTSFPCLAGSLSSSPLLLTSVNQSVCPDDSDVTEPVRSQSSILLPNTASNCSVCSSPSFPPPSALPPRITPIWSSEYLLLFVLLSSCHFLYSFLPSAFPSLSALISSPLCGYHYDRFHSAFI